MTPLSNVAQRPRSLAQHAYQAIRRSICSNRVPPGTLLSEGKLAQELAMSRTPVREALRRLEAEDFVEIRNGAGVYVKPITPDDIQNLMRVRKSLELLAAETAIFRISAPEIDYLAYGFEQLLQDWNTNGSPDPQAFTSRDYQLHELLIQRCNNKYVQGIMAGINAQIERFQSLSFSALNNLEESTRQHLALIALIRRRDSEGLQQALATHIDWAEACIFS